MANPNTPPFDDGKDVDNGSPLAKQMRDLREKPNTVAALVEKLRPDPRGQNNKILNTTRQGRTMETLKPQCPPKKGIIVG